MSECGDALTASAGLEAAAVAPLNTCGAAVGCDGSDIASKADALSGTTALSLVAPVSISKVRLL